MTSRQNSAAWIFHGNSHQAEGSASRVGTNVEDAAGKGAFESGMMVGVILVRVFARIDQPEFRLWLIGGQVADLAGGVAGTREKKKSTAARALDLDAEALVALFVEKIVGFGRVQRVAIEAVGALSGLVLHGVKKRAVVGGPGGAGDTLDAPGKRFTGAQVFDLQRVLTEPGGVERVGQ